MAIYKKQHFHTGPDGAAGILFRTGNFPRSTVFKDLFESVLFKLNPEDSATHDVAGHSRIETDQRAILRSLEVGDGFTRFVQSHHLPVVIAAPSGQHVLHSSVNNGDIGVDEYIYSYNSGETRMDYLVRSRLSFISSNNSIVITPNGEGEYDFHVNPAYSDTYMVIMNAGDNNPDYIGNKIDTSLYVTPSTLLGVNHGNTDTVLINTTPNGILANVNYQNTNSISIGEDALGLYANLILDGNTLSVGVNGVKVTKPCNDIISSNNSLATSYNVVTGVWDITLSSLIGSIGTHDVQLSDGNGGFTCVTAPNNIRFKFDAFHGGVYLGTLLPTNGVSNATSFTIGYNQNNNSYSSYMCGRTNNNTGNSSIIYGQGAINDIPLALVRGFSEIYGPPELMLGKRQEGSFPMIRLTANAEPSYMELVNTGITNINITLNTVWRVEIDMLANGNGTPASAIWSKVVFGIRNINNNVEFVGNPNVTGILPEYSDFTDNISFGIQINMTNIRIFVVGLNTEDIIWGAIVRYVRIGTDIPI